MSTIQDDPADEKILGCARELFRQIGVAKPDPDTISWDDTLSSDPVLVKSGGIILTDKGNSMAKKTGQRHALLVNFLKLLGVEETRAQKDTEGLEHYIDSRTLELLKRFVENANLNLESWNQFQKEKHPAP